MLNLQSPGGIASRQLARGQKAAAFANTHRPQRLNTRFTSHRVNGSATEEKIVEKAKGSFKSTSTKTNYSVALIFDCDGVIVETEELHRKAYNAAFDAFDLTIDGVKLVWTTEYYDVLQNTVGGGKPKMKYHFNNNGWPASTWGPAPTDEAAKNKLVDALQDKKTEHYKVIVESAAEARPGVLALMDEGLAREDVAMCICSAATKEGFEKVVNSVVGPERLAKFDIILAGDDVTEKKPSPLIYNTAREWLCQKSTNPDGLPANKCIVIEDSMVGLRAAVGAGMMCVITPTSSTASAAFCEEGAAAVIDQLAGPMYQVTIDDLFKQVCVEEECEVFPDVEGMAGKGDFVCNLWQSTHKPFQV